MRALRAVLVLVIVASALTASGSAATAAREILFVGTYDGRGDTVLAIRSDGTGLRAIAHGATPNWSPDGARIVYAQSAAKLGQIPAAGLTVVAAAGGSPTRITNGEDSWGLWAPNGRLIAFTRFEDQGFGLYIVRPDGTHLQRLRGSLKSAATWSPDSRRLLVAYKRGLVTIDLAGRMRLLPNARCADQGVWSPNGQWVAFAKCGATLSQFRIAIEHPDGSAFRLLTAGAFDIDPTWAPDSGRLAYTHFIRGSPVRTQIRMVSIRAKKLGTLDSSARDSDAMPRWSPDGRRIVFDREVAGGNGITSRLYIGDARSGHVLKLYDETASGMKSWRPR